MKLLGKKLLDNFKRTHVDSRSQIDSWQAEVEEARWNTPSDLKGRYPKASLLASHQGSQQVIFDLCGNKYRLLVLVNYKNGIVLVKKIDKHSKYDKWKLG